MINLEYIKEFFKPIEQKYAENIIKEYLQYNILSIIYDSKFWDKLFFLGWTAIRIIHNSNRFSEDLDFDNFWLKDGEFEDFSELIKKWLELQGFIVEINNIYKWAWHCKIKFPQILYNAWLSSFKEEKILIQINTVKQDYIYQADNKIIDKFWIYKLIKTCPIDILLSKKIHALIWRKRLKWRDFYDIVFLSKFTKPNYDYLNTKIWIKNEKELKEKLIVFCKNLNLKKIAEDVKPFLINKDEINRILQFRDFIENNF